MDAVDVDGARGRFPSVRGESGAGLEVVSAWAAWRNCFGMPETGCGVLSHLAAWLHLRKYSACTSMGEEWCEKAGGERGWRGGEDREGWESFVRGTWQVLDGMCVCEGRKRVYGMVLNIWRVGIGFFCD